MTDLPMLSDEKFAEIRQQVQNMPVEILIAQMMILGYSGDSPNPVFERFCETGLGGVIFFRDNFQEATQPVDVSKRLAAVQQLFPEKHPLPFLAIDQEGGQVERLPCTVFPSLMTPLAIALSKNSATLAESVYQLM